MSKKYIVFIIIIGIVGIGGYVYAKSNSAAANKPSVAISTSASLVPQTFDINILPNGFIPTLVTIHSGDTVQFVNKDTQPHWPASDPHPSHTGYPGFDALRPVAPGQEYSFQFIRTGSFGFHDHLNPNFTGKVIVELSKVANSTSPTTLPDTPIKVGSVTWHQKNFINKQVFLVGYVLKKEKGYVIFSDEATGAITAHDLPVTGVGTNDLVLKKKYSFKGVFLDKGLVASNKSKYHLELTEIPKSA